MIDILLSILRMVLMLLPFALLAWRNYKANLKKPQRYKQFLMPLIALLLCILLMCFLGDIYTLVLNFILMLPQWLRELSYTCASSLPDAMWLSELIGNLSVWLSELLRSVNLNFWMFYIVNAVLLLAYVILKRIILLFLKGFFRDGSLFQTLAGLFYEYDENDGNWNLKPQFGQARTFLKTMYVMAVVLGIVGVLVSSYLYLDDVLTEVYYPVFGVIILGELYFALNGLTQKERLALLGAEEEDADHISNYSVMCGVLRRLFPDKLSAENTTVSDVISCATTNDELLSRLEESDDVAKEAYGRFMRAKSEAGMELDFNYLLSGRQLLDGQSVLFNNPFYYDLIPYIFYPMNRAMLRHRKVLVVLGRHNAEDSVEQWCRDGLTAITNIPTMWNIGVLSQEKQELDVGIITRSSVHDLQLHENNREFFDEVEFVVLLEPSRLITTAQVGLNSIVRHCRRNKKQLVFCSADKNCDGLLDALAHILMTNLQEVSATNHHKGASSYMIWEADGEHLQHRMLPNLSRYLGVGTELSFAALKNQVPETVWYGGEAFPVVDTHWIAKQYYYDLLQYASLPASQETMDQVFQVRSDMWSAPAKENQYITVEDESFNMFEVKRDFSTRATEQGFINVVCSDYLLKDYMADNDSIFNADPKAIPYITADYARTVRNVVLRLCLRMSAGNVPENEVCRELTMVDRDAKNPGESLWREICLGCGHAGVAEMGADGKLILRCNDRGQEAVFTSDVLTIKRRFNMETGKMENMYRISDSRFVRLILEDLQMAEYVAEDENGKRQYLGTELRGHIFQKYLPGQFFTFGGKYYEMLRVTSEGQVVVRRAADHITGRPFYRQVRNYCISNPVDSTVMGECRDLGRLRITRQYADVYVQTPAYWKMDRYHDFSTGVRIGINGIPERVYNNKAILRIDLLPDEALPEGTVETLTVLFNEVLRSLLAENQDYLVALTAGDAQIPNTYSLYGAGDFQPQPGSIYLVEDSQMDIGLLDAVERNINRIFAIICDYLQWHEEAMTRPEEEQPAYEPVDVPAAETAPAKKPGFFKRIFNAIVNFFKKIFGAIGGFFKKLFGGKKATAAPAPEEPETETPETETPDVSTETDPYAGDPYGAEPAAEAGEEGQNPESQENSSDEGQDEAKMSLFSCTEGLADQAEGVVMPETEEPVQTGSGDGGDTLEFEPEQTAKAQKIFQRLPYKNRYYLRYGSDALAQTLQLDAVRDLLVSLGYGNSALTQARRGKDVAKMIERTFVPNKAGVHYCDFCGCELTGLEFDILADGRERCTACSRTAVKDLDDFRAIHDAVRRNMKLFFGVNVNAPVNVQMVNAKKLHKKLGHTFVPTGNMDGRILGVAIKDRKGYTILVENGSPKIQSTMTMVHEMTHIWQYLNWDTKDIKRTYGELELEVYEGMAKWVELQYTYLLNETATAKREEMITRHRDDPYGRGFVKYASKYPLAIDSHKNGATPFHDKKRPL